MASPYVGPTTHSQAAARATSQGRSVSLAGTAAHRGCSRSRAHPLAARCPQRGPAVGRQQRAAASRGDDIDRRGGLPLAGWLPTGKGSRRLCRGNSSGGADGVRGVRASF
ncbi:hypothetical protein B296_00058461 [Ensete ventricosum]|uniref:Uncharacterized protein n=1 Tax=Ensete ventricosum TaxID=4639 RepID=A0A426WXP7_ENSVE|nr:hypothetical protein B296_00058461 [Ensete ventricosum]